MDVSFAAALAGGMVIAEQLRYTVGGPSLGPWGGLHRGPTTDYASAKTAETLFPKCPMMYAIVMDTSILVETKAETWGAPKVQPAMSGKSLQLPALVPLEMGHVSLNVDCHISTGFVTVEGVWNLKILKSGTRCDCLLAVPIDRQGTVAGVEIELGRGRIFATLIIPKEEAASYGAKGSTAAAVGDTGTYNPDLFRLSFPQVEADSRLSMKITWFQAMEFADGLYTLRVSFRFPDYVLQVGELFANITRISCTINSGTTLPVDVGQFHHALKETSREPGRVSYTGDWDGDTVGEWRNTDFIASYKVWSDGILPNLIVQDPLAEHIDPRGVFCLSVSPPDPNSVQGFQRAVIFMLDRSGSMFGQPMDDAQAAVLSGISMLQSADLFNIIAFDHEWLCFSTQLVPAGGNAFKKAQQWITQKCDSRGGTYILAPLQQAMKMLHNLQGYVPYIFLVTDGAVNDERSICRLVQNALAQGGSTAPRISTFGIGHYCNFYFLKMLALIGRGLSDIAFSPDKIRGQMEKMLVAASTPLLTNISLAIDIPGGCEIYPFPIPDLFCGNPLIISGRFHGQFPSSVKVVGLLPNQSLWEIEVQMHRNQQIPLSKVFAKQQLDLLVAQAWLHKDRHLESQAIDLSIGTGVPCEYTRMVSFETTKEQHRSLKQELDKGRKVNIKKYASKSAKIAVVGGLVIGFGSIAATAANLAIGEGLVNLGGAWLPNIGDDADGCCGCCGGCGDCDVDCCDSECIGDLCNGCDCVDCCCQAITSLF